MSQLRQFQFKRAIDIDHFLSKGLSRPNSEKVNCSGGKKTVVTEKYLVYGFETKFIYS